MCSGDLKLSSFGGAVVVETGATSGGMELESSPDAVVDISGTAGGIICKQGSCSEVTVGAGAFPLLSKQCSLVCSVSLLRSTEKLLCILSENTPVTEPIIFSQTRRFFFSN